MYSNDTTQIQMGLTNYIGALLNASPYDNKQAQRNTICACLLKEALELCKNEDKTIDMFAAKPILKSVIFICSQRINIYSSQIKENSDIPKEICVKHIKEYSIIKKQLEQLVNSI